MPAGTVLREVVVGRNSRLWQALSANPLLAGRFRIALSHTEVSGFRFQPGDRVWVFSYSGKPEQNSRLLDEIASRDVAELVYLASSSAIVGSMTACYRYPYVKYLAERHCLGLPRGRVLVIGQVYESEDELPAGLSAATSIQELAGFMAAPSWPASSARVELFRMIERGFSGRFERLLFAIYDGMLGAAGSFPCVLRPVDAILRLAGFRWYGYVRLSNKLRSRP